MTALDYWDILRSQFMHGNRSPWYRRLKWLQMGLVLLSVAVGIFIFCLAVRTVSVGSILTATSIITGLTFTMAMRFWEKRIEITSAPQVAGFTERRAIIIDSGTHLIWTVLVGVSCTAWTAFAAMVSGDNISPWATAVCAGLLSYQLLLVALALLKLYTSSIELG